MDSGSRNVAHRTISPDEAASHVVVAAVSTVLDVEPTALEPIANTIDSDALDRIQQSMGESARLSFRYEGFKIVVTGDGEVSVNESTDGSGVEDTG